MLPLSKLSYCIFPKPFLTELCLTSNVKGQTVSSYSQHHFLYWYQMGHPSVICVSVFPKCVWHKRLTINSTLVLLASQICTLILWCSCFQTDDKGVFCTDLSQEYQLAASTFNLSQEDMWTLSQKAIDCTFAPDLQQHLHQKWLELRPTLFQLWQTERTAWHLWDQNHQSWPFE
jgi:hypothetical protein